MPVPTVTEVCAGTLQHTQCAGFDMDDTLIYGSDKSGYRAYPFAVKKIKELYNAGYNILVFSNQKKPQQSDKIVFNKIKAVQDLYSPVPIHFFCARADDQYRKPEIGMLSLVPKAYGPLKFFVGDADGNEGAFSDADSGFAQGAGVPFFTPEKYFNVFETIEAGKVPVPLRDSHVKIPTLVLLVGYPGSGKSTFCRDVLPHFARVSRDELGTVPKCLAAARKILEAGNGVIIDNTNPSAEKRAPFIELAQECKSAVVAVHMRVSMSVAQGRNEKRDGKAKVPQIAFFVYRKEFEIPSIDEGIDQVYAFF